MLSLSEYIERFIGDSRVRWVTFHKWRITLTAIIGGNHYTATGKGPTRTEQFVAALVEMDRITERDALMLGKRGDPDV